MSKVSGKKVKVLEDETKRKIWEDADRICWYTVLSDGERFSRVDHSKIVAVVDRGIDLLNSVTNPTELCELAPRLVPIEIDIGHFVQLHYPELVEFSVRKIFPTARLSFEENSNA